MGKILVTGASGNVGGFVLEYLRQAGQPTVAAGTRPERLEEGMAGKAECRYLDFSKPDSFQTALEDIDRVFLMRPPQMGDPGEMLPFLTYMRDEKNIKMAVFLSLIGIEKNPMPPHHKIEKYIRQSGIPYCFLRPSFFMQNLSGIHAFEIQHFDRVVVPVGRALTSFIDAEDIGEIGAEVLLEPDAHKNTAYDLTGPEAIDYYRAAEIFSEELGREIRYDAVSPGLALNYWIHIRGIEAEYAKVMHMLYRLTRMGTAKHVADDFEKVMKKKPHDFRMFVRKNKDVWVR